MKRKVALITGGATGIGKRIAIELAKEQYDIVITYVHSDSEAFNLVKRLEKEFQITARCFKSDASCEEECIIAFNKIKREFTTIDIFIHNAGPYIHERKKMSKYSNEEWQYIINGNLNSFFYLSSLLLPNMREQAWGRMITFGFERSDTAPGWMYRSAFAAAKSGLTSLTKTLAKEEAENGITVNMVCPGDIISEWKERSISEAEYVIDGTIPVGRPGTGEDIARVVAFLCKEESSFITGSVIPVTGGKDVLSKIHQS